MSKSVPWDTRKIRIRSAIILNKPWHNLGKIIRLRISTSLFFCQNKKVQIIQRLPCITKLNK